MQSRLPFTRNATGEIAVNQISIQMAPKADQEAVKTEITNLLVTRHQVATPDFTVQSQNDLLGAASEVSATLSILLGSVAGISLLVGGIGVMNIMLVSVTERTREIGIRKAVGAKKRDILVQFLIESVLLSVVGGALGVLFGWGLAEVVDSLGAFATVITGQSVLLAVGFSAMVGLFFGIYPARRASNLDPIEALRYE